MKLNIIDYLFLYSLLSIWALLLLNIILALSGHKFYAEIHDKKANYLEDIKIFPMISIMIPAHNEEQVIRRTMEALLKIDYPPDKIEIIVINDNSSDNTGQILSEIKEKNSRR